MTILPSMILSIAASQLGVTDDPMATPTNPYHGAHGTSGPWSAVFLRWCFEQAGAPFAADATHDLNQPAGWSQMFKRDGRLETDMSTARPGDVAILTVGPGGTPDHVGLVEGTDSGNIITIDGDVDGQVTRVARSIDDPTITGLGRPPYGEPSAPQAEAGPEAERLVLHQGLDGQAVRVLQRKLNAAGTFALDVDGRFGPRTRDAVEQVQGWCSLTQDGVVGPQTWDSIESLLTPPSPSSA